MSKEQEEVHKLLGEARASREKLLARRPSQTPALGAQRLLQLHTFSAKEYRLEYRYMN